MPFKLYRRFGCFAFKESSELIITIKIFHLNIVVLFFFFSQIRFNDETCFCDQQMAHKWFAWAMVILFYARNGSPLTWKSFSLSHKCFMRINESYGKGKQISIRSTVFCLYLVRIEQFTIVLMYEFGRGQLLEMFIIMALISGYFIEIEWLN